MEKLADARDLKSYNTSHTVTLHSGEIKTEKTFREASELFLREYDIITQGQRSRVYVEGQQRRSQGSLVPFFGPLGLSPVTACQLHDHPLPPPAEPAAPPRKPPPPPPTPTP